MLRTLVALTCVISLCDSTGFVLGFALYPAGQHLLRLSGIPEGMHQKSFISSVATQHSKRMTKRSRITIMASMLPFKEALVQSEVDPDIACVLCESEASALASLSKHPPGVVEGTFR